MRKKTNALDVIVNLLCAVLLLGGTLYIVLGWNSFPAQIPAHYNALGEVDRWGNRGELLFLPILSWILFGLITLVEQFPQIWNTGGISVTPENAEKLYRILKTLIDLTKLAMLAAFTFLTVNSSLGDALPSWYLFAFLGALFAVIGVSIVRLVRLQRQPSGTGGDR